MNEKQFKELLNVINAQTLVLNAGFQTCAALLARINARLSSPELSVKVEEQEAQKAIQNFDSKIAQALQVLPDKE